jgi:DNA polymerase III delta prime subunit
MFAKKDKPLPMAVLTSSKKGQEIASSSTSGGVHLGEDLYWNPLALPNPHLLAVGTSGSGKTQTILAIASELVAIYQDLKIIILDLHGDQNLPGEVCYALNQESPHGVNPLVLDLDSKGGGPGLQAIAVAATLKRSLVLGAVQEGVLIDALGECYKGEGIQRDDQRTWVRKPPTFENLQKNLVARSEDGCKESAKLLIKFAGIFHYGIFVKPQPELLSPLIRFDLSALGKVPGLGAIAVETILKQIMDRSRLGGAVTNSLSTYCFIDEAREVKKSPTVKTIVRDGRKYGLGIGLASQLASDFDEDLLANTALKILLAIDRAQLKQVATKLKFAEGHISELNRYEALVRLGNTARKVRLIPYFEREAAARERQT